MSSVLLCCVVLAGGRGCATARQARNALSCAHPPRERRRAVGALQQLALGRRSDAAAGTAAWRNHLKRLSNVRGPPAGPALARPSPPLPAPPASPRRGCSTASTSASMWPRRHCQRWALPGTAVLCCGHVTWGSFLRRSVELRVDADKADVDRFLTGYAAELFRKTQWAAAQSVHCAEGSERSSRTRSPVAAAPCPPPRRKCHPVCAKTGSCSSPVQACCAWARFCRIKSIACGWSPRRTSASPRRASRCTMTLPTSASGLT